MSVFKTKSSPNASGKELSKLFVVNKTSLIELVSPPDSVTPATLSIKLPPIEVVVFTVLSEISVIPLSASELNSPASVTPSPS